MTLLEECHQALDLFDTVRKTQTFSALTTEEWEKYNATGSKAIRFLTKLGLPGGIGSQEAMKICIILLDDNKMHELNVRLKNKALW